MFKKYYSLIITVITAVLAYLLLTAEPDIKYVDSGVLRVDTIYKYWQLDPDTVIRKFTKVEYIEVPVENPNTDIEDFEFTVNLFDKGKVLPAEMQVQDIYKYIVTKPFEAVDSVITKKLDTIITDFTLSVGKPGEFRHQIYYSPVQEKIIVRDMQAPRRWYDEQWFRYGSLTLAFIVGVYSGLQVK